MTNGEKIKEVFPNTKIITQYDNPFGDRFMVFTLNNEDMQVNIDWWNAEYKESTTPNDCETCIHNKGVLECDMYGCKYEPTTKNDLGVDAISRADARSLICKIDLKYHMSGMSRKVLKDLYNGMDELPSVTPQEPRKGHWIPLGYEDEWWGEVCNCSECGSSIFRSNYCPNCGADMREPQESEDKE